MTEELDKLKLAAISAVIAEMNSGGNKSGAKVSSNKSGRENWKMAGRAERLGISVAEKK